MPKQAIAFAADIQSRMQRSAKQVMTMPWPEFYSDMGIKRFREERGLEVSNACAALGIVVGYGRNVITFCHDANFSA